MVSARRLLLLVAAACNAKPQPPQPAPPLAHDPWAPSPGSSYDPLAGSDVPAWAHDPPALLRDKINGVNAHVVVLKSYEMPEYRDVLATAEKTPGVVAAEPFIFSEPDIAKGSGPSAQIAVKAVDPGRVARVLTIGKHMVTGSLDALASGDPPAILLGDEVARRLDVRIGDTVTLTVPTYDSPAAPQPSGKRTKPFRVAGTFHMDFDEYDNRLGLASLPAMQALIGRGDQVMGIEMTVNDVAHADAIAKALESRLGGAPYQTMDWYELNKHLFTALYGDKRP
jgi:lipoprotein-releasing system permease protein